MPPLPFLTTALYWLAEKLRKVLIWLGFVVLFALLPLFYAYNSARMHHRAISLDSLLDDGSLFLVAAAVGADALSRVVSKLIPRIYPRKRPQSAKEPGSKEEPEKKPGLWELILFLACGLIVILSASDYSSWFEVLASKQEIVDVGYVVTQSCDIFLAVLAIGMCVILTVDE